MTSGPNHRDNHRAPLASWCASRSAANASDGVGLALVASDHVPDVVQQRGHDERIVASGGDRERSRLQLVLDHRDVLAEVRHSLRRRRRSGSIASIASSTRAPTAHRSRRRRTASVDVSPSRSA